MPRPKIKDIAVLSRLTTDRSGFGEAPREPFVPMNLDEREKMQVRLFNQISDLMTEAHTTHIANYKLPGSEQIDPDYITRLSTHEFFFYTKEPLTLNEFERLQNKIIDKAATLPPGIHLVLGSFAVKNENNQVMNLTPHITCGQPPSLQILIKNYTSTIDVRYKEIRPEEGNDGEALEVFDGSTAYQSMPKINVKGASLAFQFSNVIHCKTPGGNSFLMAIDICLDHYWGVAKSNIEALVKKTPRANSLPVSHMIVSNSIVPRLLNSIGLVMQVDPIDSPQKCKKNVKQEEREMSNLPKFGADPFVVYELATTPCQTLQESFKENPERLFEKLETLRFGANDVEMDQFIQEKRAAFQKTEGYDASEVLRNELDAIVNQLASESGLLYIRSIISDFRKKAAPTAPGSSSKRQKANGIENQMSKISIENRCNFTQLSANNAKETENVMLALAAHRSNLFTEKGSVYIDQNGSINLKTSAKSYQKYFKEVISKIRKEVEPKEEEKQDETKKTGI